MATAGGLKRELDPMPAEVLAALRERGLLDAHRARPACQRNDCLGWIARTRREDTRSRRLQQMLDELRRGDAYMNMAWRPRAPR
ncbi:YdeI/OmpD-associated family protein [Marilutibacter maris]|uniref:YdeI/OmpD-associated family protein n=1 Tax=Marilutibacter maris TaxID=1605891 RepID=A0A2U9T968_9GAMM|nr:YdeI/OmpD-associated family protein [Lysobacter maris]AWV08122.1 hypothetical protein C9I47_2444 [Lysobacter maris]